MLSLIQSPPQAPPPHAFNMAEYVLTHADHLPEKPALHIVGTAPLSLTYADLKRAVLGTASGLLGYGLRAGDKVLLRIGNTPDFPIAYLAAISVGIIPVPLSAQLTPPEVAHIEAIIKPKLSLQSPDQVGGSTPVLITGKLADFRTLPPAKFIQGDPNRPAYIVFTSGTSGQPRAVVHAHRAIWARQTMHRGWYGLRRTDRLMHAGALNWTYTMGTGLMDPWSVGATALIPSAGTPAADLPQLIADHQATLFAASPGIYRQMMRTQVPPLPALRHGLSAGEKLGQADRQTWETQTKTPVYEAFGMSECSTFISSAPDRPATNAASGYVQKGRTVALVDKNGPVPIGMTGTIAIDRNDQGLMLGYLDAPGATAARFQGNWFLTGDQACMAPDGAITFLGRADDMMNAGGHRVSPIEVEGALSAHPQLSEVAACAVQVRTGVFVIAGFYVSADVIDHDQLHDFAAARLAAYKTPRLYVACDNLPRGANNKLLRHKLRSDWETANGQA